MNKIDAPVVPTKLAVNEAIIKRHTFLKGVLRECRSICTPPVMVNKAKISVTKGIYSRQIVLKRIWAEAPGSVDVCMIITMLNMPQKPRI